MGAEQNGTGDASDMMPQAVTLGAIAKNEARYLPEWLAYHLAIGFDRIVVYSNDTEDYQNELLDEVARCDARVQWIDWPSVPGQYMQNMAYNDLLARCETPWIGFLDIDEFFVPLLDANVHEWLATVPDDVSTVHVNWRGFGSSGLTSTDYGLVTRSFDMAASVEWGNHHHFKTFARVARAAEATIHNVSANSGRRTLSDFGDFTTVNQGLSDRIAYHRVQVNHYQCKTFPEFEARMRRGSATVPQGHPLRTRDGSLERFKVLDRNDALDRSIRRFDAVVDESLKRIEEIIAPVSAKYEAQQNVHASAPLSET